MSTFSHTGLETFRTCPRLYWYSYVCGGEGVEPLAAPADALEHGRAIDELWKSAVTGQRAAALAAAIDLDPCLRALAEVYIDRWLPSNPLPPLRTDVPLPPLRADVANALGFGHVVGYLDGLSLDGQEIVELKTTSQSIEVGGAYWSQVHWSNVQVGIYLLVTGARQVTYEVMRKPGFRGKKGESEYDLLDRAKADIEANLGHYFARQTVTRTEDELRQLSEELRTQVAQIGAGVRYRNPSGCFKWGRRCEFFGPCWQGVDPISSGEFRPRQRRQLKLFTEET